MSDDDHGRPVAHLLTGGALRPRQVTVKDPVILACGSHL